VILFAERRRPTFGTLQALCLALDMSLPDVICFQATGAVPSGDGRTL
jgi:DNA-binding Xre family transcriptional regulator